MLSLQGRKECHDATCNKSRRSWNIRPYVCVASKGMCSANIQSNLIKLDKAESIRKHPKAMFLWANSLCAWNEGGPSIWRFVQHLLPGMSEPMPQFRLHTNTTQTQYMRNFVSHCQSKATFIFMRNRARFDICGQCQYILLSAGLIRMSWS